MRFTIVLAILAGPIHPAEVDPFIGTSNGGNTFPGAVAPWGMVSVSPHNDLGAPAGYTHGKPLIFGFGHVHLSGVGCPDLGNIVLLPQRGNLDLKSGVSYSAEAAEPGYYRVQLGQDITAEMCSTTRTGFSRYRFAPATSTVRVQLMLSQALKPVSAAEFALREDGSVEGYSQSGGFCGNKIERKVYFSLRSLPAPLKAAPWQGPEKGASLVYASSTAEVLVKVGISYVSVKNARQNLEAENPGWAFEEVRAQAKAAWEAELAKIGVQGGDAEQRQVFYTALYHSLLHPNVFSDVNGEYKGLEGSGVKLAQGHVQYSVFSLWDTYRTLHPLLILLYPGRQLDMLRSMAAMSRDSGWLPKWELAGTETYTMVGDPALPVIADSWLAGLRDFDVDSSWTAAWRSATELGSKIRPGLKSLQKYGYIAEDDSQGDWVWGSVSSTLEYAYADWALAQWAAGLGKAGPQAWLLDQRAPAWKALFDPETKFLRPRLKSGEFLPSFDSQKQCCDKEGWADNGGPGYVEGNAWQYSWFVPHDIPGLMQRMGGKAAFAQKLQACVDKGHFVLSNEPDMAYPWLFNYAPGEAWRTRKTVRDSAMGSFKAGPGGIPGNDDCGTTSAWLVWASLGLYPDCPGSGLYQLSSPLFEELTLNLEGGKLLQLRDRSSDGIKGDFYFNGKLQKKPAISREALMAGGDLLFE